MSYKDKVRNHSRNSRSSVNWGRLTSWFRDRLLSDRPSITSRTVFICLLGIVLTGGLACQVIWQQVRHMRASAEISRLQRQNHDLTMKIQQKKLVVSRLERLDRIQRIAVQQLGMEPLDRAPVIEMSQTHWVQSSREGDEPMVP
jgi:cell division protein FtsL